MSTKISEYGEYGDTFGGMTALVFTSTADAMLLLLSRGADANVWYTPPQNESSLMSRSVLVGHLALHAESSPEEEEEEGAVVLPGIQKRDGGDAMIRLLIRFGADVNDAGHPCYGTGQDEGREYIRQESPTSIWPRVVASDDVSWARELLEFYGADPDWPPMPLVRKTARHHHQQRVCRLFSLRLQCCRSQSSIRVSRWLSCCLTIMPILINLSKYIFKRAIFVETIRFSFFRLSSACIIGGLTHSKKLKKLKCPMRRWGGGLLHSTGEEEDNEGLEEEEEEEEEEEYILVSHEKKATALSVAIGKGSVDIIEMLKAHGACAQPSNAKEPITFSF